MGNAKPASGNGPAMPKRYFDAHDAASETAHAIEGLAFAIGQLACDHLTNPHDTVHTAINRLCTLLDKEVAALMERHEAEWEAGKEAMA